MISGVSQSLSLKGIRIQDAFWSDYIRLVREVVVPYQWEVLNDRVDGAEPSHAIRNFKIAAGMEQGEFYGMVFQDSDVAKWLEAVGHLLETRSDPVMEQWADGIIDIIAKAQQEDGYLNTYFTLKEPGKQWTNLAECHELYCAGHMIEAGVAYYRGTGKRKLLEVVCRLADCIDRVFGLEPGQIKGYDGHQEIEMALVKLYRTTGREKYLKLSQFFLDQRGRKPHFYKLEWEKRGRTSHFPELSMIEDYAYSQSHLPVREQETAEGHAVRVVYMCTGMAVVAAETGDESLLEACRKLWHNIVSRRMYITGGIGSMAQGESFTLDYDLPSDTAYAETCASIGLIFFARQMLLIEPRSEYADVMERALYNTVVSGMSRDGRHFFYVNPLEVHPEAQGKNKNVDHVKPERQGWFGCACCPPNIARLLASLGEYIYSIQGRTIYTHLYVGNETTLDLHGRKVKLVQQSQFPWEGFARFEITPEQPTEFALALRIPDWCANAAIRLNGIGVPLENAIVNGYARINRKWEPGDVVEAVLPMSVYRMQGHPLVRETSGKVALQRGPVVYCLEEADNGPNLHQIILDPDAEPEAAFDAELLGGLQTIRVKAQRVQTNGWGELLYKAGAEICTDPVTARFIPYFAWANRGRGEMSVWVREN